ncbi:tRNA-guanine transglycosylase [Pyrolobus fumarii 1A]|uniref:tRNA-guanine(15) transglycosylase n=1 Tax=Pyrolobus fumarii (strain DSM 11204 / 1A) TaxID=694429 RepID=G0EEC9_PYRF1|nr:tRNA guanosine(15) transglycosylase TgtA [Pyrolobus fumarii]AEM37970.1 tRNA-guanine transglycosylase [Pyrolobus fumarii 1A]
MKREVGLFEVRDKDLAGRIGRLYTPHGVLETPALLPVIDPARQEPSIDEIKSLGFNAVITNAYLAWRRWRNEAVEKGIHRLLDFDGIVMTDSGAYQLMRYGSVEITPEEVIRFQQRIGSDIAVILDVPTGSTDSRDRAAWTVEETLRRAREAINLIEGDERIWTLPIQGGPYTDLVEKASREASKLSRWYKLYAVGSPTVLLERYSYEKIIEMVATARFNTPLSHPLHLFGAGHPMIIPFAVALGVDMFDSASYILYARDNRYITPYGTHRLEDMDYFPCSCPVCAKYTPQELLEMPAPERIRLLALHNLYVLRQEINRVKLAIREGRLWELLVEKAHTHPSLKRALQTLVKYAEMIEKLDPRLKGGEVHGLFLYAIPEELKRPEVIRHHKRVLESYKPPSSTLVLYPLDLDAKPATSSPRHRKLRSKHPGAHLVAYAPVIGPIPEELAETYPLSQFEAPRTYPLEALEETVSIVAQFVEKHGYKNVTIYVAEEEWTRLIAERLVARLAGRVEKIETRVLEEE